MAQSIDTSDFTPQRTWTPKAKPQKATKKEVEDFWKEEYQLPSREKAILELAMDKRPPRNKDEEDLLKEINSIRDKGQIIDFQGEVF